MIVGVVVLYNPDFENIIKNINSYVSKLDKLLIVDNSESFDEKISNFFKYQDSVCYKYLEENKGIAYALNRGIDYAKEHNANWLLTMDQDSSFSNDNFYKFINFIKVKSNSYNDGVIFSPLHKVPYLIKEQGITKVRSVMTSGNIINMKLIDKIGYFDEDLFIDSVDHEYCYRINKKGYSVYRINNIELEHNLGELVVKEIFGKKLFVTNHNYIRRYYITRNLLYVVESYSNSKLGFIRFAVENLFWSFLTIVLYEKDKSLKLKSMRLGLLDYKRGKLGKKVF